MRFRYVIGKIKRSAATWVVGLMVMGAAQAAATDFTTSMGMGPFESHIRHLAEFEAAAVQSPEALAAAAALEENLFTQTLIEAQSGWRFFGGTDIGRYRENVTNDYQRTYERLDVRAGLKYPLFGARVKEREQIAKSRWDTKSKEYENALVKRQSLLALRLYYINYWSAQEKTKVAEEFLRYQPVMEHVLNERTAAGQLRESDRRGLIAAFASVQRDLARSEAMRRHALGALHYLANSAQGLFQAAYPVMTEPCTDQDRLESLICRQHPRMLMAADAVEEQKMLLAFADKTQANGHVSVFASLSSEFESPEPEYGVGINVNFDLPLHVYQAISAKRQAARAAFEKAKQQAEAIRREVVGKAHETLGRYLTAEKNITFAIQRLSSAREAVREDLLRYAYLTGDVIEQLQKSRFEYYKAATDCIDAFTLRLQQQANLLSFVPGSSDACGSNSAPGANTSEGMTPVPWSERKIEDPSIGGRPLTPREEKGATPVQSDFTFTVYVWDSASLLSRFENRPGVFARLRAKHIDRLLVSYSAAQIDALETDTYLERWRLFIMAAHRNGFRVDMLLGEPLWILPDHRRNMLDIIRRLSRLPFQGIHLDLEPNQLMHRQESEAYLLSQLVAGVKAVRALSPLSLGLSVHYRYLDPSRPDEGLAKELKAVGVNEVTMMVYNADPDRVAEIAAPILRSFPELRFSIAQSVEPILSSKESHATRSVGEFWDHMRRLRSELRYPNFETIMIQSWADYEKMQP